MKRKFNLRKISGRRNIFLAVLSLILVIMTAVTATSSWIEEISQVEFSSTDGQETPLHVGSKILKSDAVMKKDQTADTIDLDDYFYKSGDMHLSPCYSDGENFYFPVKGGGGGYRIGNKDDANVNYLSATFKIISEGAGTVYWFEKSGDNNDTPYVQFKKDTGNKDSNGNPIYNSISGTGLEQYLRLSITVDGATTVYALNNNGSYYTLSGGNPTAVAGRAFEQYTYYNETFNQSAPEGYYKNDANVTNKPNQGAGNNLNGNTLFNVNKYDQTNKTGVKTVTVKMWLEQKTNTVNNNPVLDNTFSAGVDIASININLVSSWAKSRRVYVKDSTVYQSGYSQAKWLSTQSAKLYFAVKDNMQNAHYEMEKIPNTDFYYADIPAVYNNADAILFRCNGGWNVGNHSVTYNNVTVSYWDKWETTFPNTFHSETYTVYTSTFGTWDEHANYVYFVNSCNSGPGFSNRTPRAYMWDSASVHGSDVNDKVVKNADWTGVELVKMKNKVTGKNIDMDLYVFYYNSIYDRIIFNDNFGNQADRYQYQTQDLYLSNLSATGQMNNPYFDMASLAWYSSTSNLPKYTNVFLKSNFRGGGYNMETRFVYDKNGNGSTKWCDFYIKSDKTSTNNNYYEFTIWDGDNNREIKCHKDSGKLELNTEYTFDPNNGDFNKKFFIQDITRGVYRLYYYPNSNKIKLVQIENFQP